MHPPRVQEEFVETKPPITGDDVSLGVVNFSMVHIWITQASPTTQWPPLFEASRATRRL